MEIWTNMITIIYVCDQEPGKSCHIRLPKLIREVFLFSQVVFARYTSLIGILDIVRVKQHCVGPVARAVLLSRSG